MRINPFFNLAFVLVGLSLSACSLSNPFSPTPTPPAPNEKVIGDGQFGVYIKGAAWDKSRLYSLETEVGHTFDIIQWFTSWPAPYEDYLVNRVHDIGRIPLITWQSSGISLQDINAGLHDGYIRTWARGVAEAKKDVYLRIFPEMNGNWVSWNGNPEALKQAWTYIVEIFREEGAKNARWVWSPNVTDEPKIPENRMELYYPGNDVVDILALDGFNWGTVRSYTAWKEFETIFTDPYSRITALGSQPVWLTEIASTEHGGDKATWINTMLESKAFPRIDALIWFNEIKETDWRIESSDDSLEAFRTWFTARQSSLLAAR